MPWSKAATDDGTFKGGDELKDLYRSPLVTRSVTSDVRLLDRTGEFTAEVPTSATGHFRFFAAPGEWTLRTLAPKTAPVDRTVVAERGVVAKVAASQ